MHQACKLGPVAGADLGEDVRQMPLDGLRGDDERVGDLAIAGAGRDEPRDLQLAIAQGLEARGAASSAAPPCADTELTEPALREPTEVDRADSIGKCHGVPVGLACARTLIRS